MLLVIILHYPTTNYINILINTVYCIHIKYIGLIFVVCSIKINPTPLSILFLVQSVSQITPDSTYSQFKLSNGKFGAQNLDEFWKTLYIIQTCMVAVKLVIIWPLFSKTD